MTILVTGGAGYIGSHTVLVLLESGYDVVVIDNLSNSSRESLKRVETLSGKSITFYPADVGDTDALNQIFESHKIAGVIHFAGFKAVGESVEEPVKYYQNNVANTLTLMEVMAAHGCNQLIFSSSATVYGASVEPPYHEAHPTAPINPYGWSKLMVEQAMQDFANAQAHFNSTVLRYFNPVGAHPSGQIGEDPKGVPNNLMPFVAQTACGRRDKLKVFGSDYPTVDGTGVRDYIHVMDLAEGHVAALEALQGVAGFHVFNLGVGHGVSVLELVHAFEKHNQLKIPYEIVERRPGDIAASFADVSHAIGHLNWSASRSVKDMVIDTWRWQSANPNGYSDDSS